MFFKECVNEEEKRIYNGNQIYPNSQFVGNGEATSNVNLYSGPNEIAR